MTWIKLEDTLPFNPKIAALSDRAYRLHTYALCYCGLNLTDGLIHTHMLNKLGIKDAKKHAQKLVEIGLWKVVENGYEINDYLKYQTSKMQAERDKETNRLRAEKARQSKSEALRNGVTNGVRTGGVTVTDTHTPTPTDIKNSLSDLKIELKESFELCELLSGLIVRNGGKQPNITKSWIQEMNRIITIDERSPREIKYLIEWSQRDPFWCSNILSPKSLRAKFDQLRLKSPLSGHPNPKPKVEGSPSQSSNRFEVSEQTPQPPKFSIGDVNAPTKPAKSWRELVEEAK